MSARRSASTALTGSDARRVRIVARTITVAGTITGARAERRRLLAAGRPARAVRAERDSLDEFTASYFRAKAPVLAGATIRNREADYLLRIAPTLGELPLRKVTS